MRQLLVCAFLMFPVSCASRWPADVDPLSIGRPVTRPAQLTEQERQAALLSREANHAYWSSRTLPSESAAGADGWTSHGPTNLAGITYSFLLDPANSNVLWSGTAEALWKSSDGGESWTAVPAIEGNGVLGLARDPRNGDTMYAGSGQVGLGGVGVFRSDDRGATWQKLPSAASFGEIYSIAIHPGDGSLLIGASRGILRSTDRGATVQSVRSVSSGRATVLFDPADATRAIASYSSRSGNSSLFLYSRDSGKTWQQATGIDTDAVGAISAYAPSLPSRVYALTNPFRSGSILWRSDDGGQTFTRLSSTTQTGGGGLLANLWISPVDPQHLIIGMVNALVSHDGGVTLKSLPLQNVSAYVQFPHADHHGIASDPRYDGGPNRRLFIWTDGGVFRTDDAEAPSPIWTPLHRNHQSTQYYVIDVSARGKIVGGMQDTGISIHQPGAVDVEHPRDGDVINIAFDPADDSRFYIGVYGRLYTSPTLETPLVDVGAGASVGFGAPFAIDPNSPSRIFVGSGSIVRVDSSRITTIRPPDGVRIAAIAVQRGDSNVVWAVNDKGAIFRTGNALSAAPMWETMRSQGPPPTSLLIDAADPNTLYLTGFNSGLTKTTDGGRNWASGRENPSASLPAGVYDLAQHPLQRSVLYAGTEVGLYVSFDSGRSWAIARSGVPSASSVRSVRFQPGTTRLFVGTYGRGIWSMETAAPPRRRAVSHS